MEAAAAKTPANSSRVHASRQCPVKRAGGNTPLQHACQECGASVGAQRAHSTFCDAKCRAAFNNRQKSRGAEIYALLMTQRYDRKSPHAKGLWTKVTRMLKSMRDEDHAERDSRHSWPEIGTHLAARPHRFAIVNRPKKGARRK